MSAHKPPASRPLTAGDATAGGSVSPAASAVASEITAANKMIASAFEHGRKAVTLRDHLIAQAHFAVARRLARWAWRIAAAGKRRIT